MFKKIFYLHVVIVFFSLIWNLSAQEFTFLAQRTQGIGDAIVRVEVINPAATTADSYRVRFVKSGENLLYSVENLTQQTTIFNNLPLGSSTPIFNGIQVTVQAMEPQFKEFIEVQYAGNPVEPPVPIFRPGDAQGKGGANSTGEYTFVGGGSSGDLNQITRNGNDNSSAAPFDYELRFDGNPEGRNKFVYAFTGSGIIDVPFSLWNIGIATPDDPTDDHQIIAIGFDDSGNTQKYDGGARPSDGGPGTMYDRIYFYEIDQNALPEGDINNDGVVNYDDFLQDLANTGGTNLSQPSVFLNRAYVGHEILARFSMVNLNGNPDYLPPVGTTIRITTTKPLSENDVYEFTTSKFGLYTFPISLSFGDVKINQQITRILTLINHNNFNITISDITADHPDFQVSENRFIIPPGDSVSVQVTFSPTNSQAITAHLTIRSNDPFFPEYRVKLEAEGLPPTTGPIDIRAHVDLPGSGTTDVWGFVDENTGKEYALLGAFDGVAIVDVSNPSNPELSAKLRLGTIFDVKAWRHYAYAVNGGTSGNGFVIDVNDPRNPQVVGTFPSGHNLFITDSGYMIKEIPGVQVWDLNPDPTNPQMVWQGGVEGHDASVIGNRLYDFHGTAGTFIYDFTNPKNPVLLGEITDPAISYHHSGWTSRDGRYLFICDELAQNPSPDITVWDIQDPANPVRVGQFADSTATVHNLYIIGDFAFISYYTAGFRVLDVSDPTHPKLLDEFDTTPEITGEGFAGAWGVYPFTPSGNIYVSDIKHGLYVFNFKGTPTSVGTNGQSIPERFALLNNFPNPFNPETVIVYQIPKRTNVQIRIFNILGQSVRSLLNKIQAPGKYFVTWDGKNDSGQIMPSGIYFYQLKAGKFKATRRMLLLR